MRIPRGMGSREKGTGSRITKKKKSFRRFETSLYE